MIRNLRSLRSLLTIAAPIAVALILGFSCSRSPESKPEGGEATQAPGDAGPGKNAEGETPGSGKPDEGVVELTAEAQASAGIETAVVAVQALGGELETTGEVGFNEDRKAHVGPRIAGRITAVRATLGQRVSQGETLAVLDSTELGQAKAAFHQARAREDLTRETYEREKKLAADKISSEQEALTAKAAHLEAAAELRRSEESLRLMGLSERQIQSLRQGEPVSSLSSVSSPFAGTVVEKAANLGEMVSPEQMLFTIADLSRVWIWIDVFEKDLRNVHPGDGATVLVDAFPGETFAGEVSLLSGSVDSATRTVRARVDVANRGGRLRPGMFARVRLTDPHARPTGPGVPVVSEGALQRQGDGFVVFVPEGERRYRRREVRTGRRAGEWIEVLSGLKEGERVVVKGTFVLASELAKDTLGEGE